MTAAQRYEDAKRRAAKWPPALEQLKATNVAVHQAFSYYMATDNLQDALVMCISILAETHDNLVKELMEQAKRAAVVIQADESKATQATGNSGGEK